MEVFAFVFSDCLHILKIIIICDMLFLFKRKEGMYRSIISAIITIITSYVIEIYDNDIIELFLYLLVVCIIIMIMYRDNSFLKVVTGVWLTLITSILDIMSTIQVKVLFCMFEGNISNFEMICAAILSLLVIYLLGKYYKSKYSVGIKTIGLKKFIIFTVLSLVDAVVILNVAVIILKMIPEKQRFFYSVAFIFMVFGIFIQLAAVILSFVSRSILVEKEAIVEKYLEDQKSHYEYLEKREYETKKFRHDVKHHLEIVGALSKEGKYDETRKYLDQINVKVESLGNAITLGNSIVDAIVNKYYYEAQQKGINITISGVFPVECKITAYDVCTIFSNILSNAIEAAYKATEKKIMLNCRYNENNVMIVLKNTFEDIGQFSEGKIKTNKVDTNYHGFGMENIKESVNRYNGDMNIEIDDGQFILMISIER